MQRIIYLALTLALISINSHAQNGSSYDWQTGNSYNYNTYGNNTHVRGNNFKNGSMWNTTIDNQTGNMRGRDSKGNSWNYNAQTGYYFNSNGTTCFGKGQFRQCN